MEHIYSGSSSLRYWLIGAIVAGLFGKRHRAARGALVTIAGVGIAFVLSLAGVPTTTSMDAAPAYRRQPVHLGLLWATCRLEIGFLIDRLTATMAGASSRSFR